VRSARIMHSVSDGRRGVSNESVLATRRNAECARLQMLTLFSSVVYLDLDRHSTADTIPNLRS